MSIHFTIKPFDDLTSVDVYHILRARCQVFVVEQKCAYQDIDGIDFDCLHLVAHQNEALIGYCRIIPPNVEPITPESSDVLTSVTPNPNLATKTSVSPVRIGRVLVLPEHRGDGLARQIMTQAINYSRKTYKKRPIAISAQTYLIKFYQSLGFESVGEPYLEDGIEHIDMIMQTAKKSKLPSFATLSTPNYLSIVLLILGILLIAGVIYLMV